MLKRLSILLLAVILAVPAMAQSGDCCECMFAPRAGQWQFNLVTGESGYLNDYDGLFYLLDQKASSTVGIGIGDNAYISDDLSKAVFNIGSFNVNSLTNIAGLQAQYFITNHIDINLMGMYNVNLQPTKNYNEGTTITDPFSNEPDPDLSTYPSKAILGDVSHKLSVKLGSNYHFNTRNPRVDVYAGVFGGFQMARIEAFYPYTGELSSDEFQEEIGIYRASQVAGQALAFSGGLVGGVSYAILPGLNVGFEVAPVAYSYGLLHLVAGASDPYYACNHNIRAFTFPQLKVGIRF